MNEQPPRKGRIATFLETLNMRNREKKKKLEPFESKGANSAEYQSAEFGKVVSSFEKIKADKNGYAEVFSEGSPALKKLLLHMWDNDIETLACCTGHVGTPYYTKDTVFGPKEIDLATYSEHYGDPHYHCSVKNSTGYFTVKMDVGLDKMRALRDDLKQRLDEVKPALPCRVTYSNDRLGINMDHAYVSKAEKERVFSHLTEALSQTLGIPQPGKVLSTDREITAEERSAILKDPFAIQHMEQTPELCKLAVSINGEALKHVKEQTPEICMAAVRQRGCALQYVKDQTADICAEAVQSDPMAIQHVKWQTPELCCSAVRRNSYAMKYVRNQTEQVCMEAVKFSGAALQHMRNPSLEVCKAAVKIDPPSIAFVPKHLIESLTKAMVKAQAPVKTAARTFQGFER